MPIPRLVMSLLLAVPTAAQLSPVVALWPFDETAGTLVPDLGPLGQQGTLVNFGVSPWVPGRFGNALSFDGVDDYVAIAPVFDLPVYRQRAAPFSICFWVQAPAQSDRRVYSEQASAPTGVGPLFTLGSGSSAAGATDRLRVFVRTDAASVAVDALSQAPVFDGSWHHVAYVDDQGRVRIYVDGAFDSSFDYSQWSYGPASTLPGSYAGIDSTTLGAVVRNGVVAAPLQGVLDELQVYRAALDAGDVQAIFAGAGPNLVVGSLGVFGQGCGPGPLRMVATGAARFGDTVYLQAVQGTPGALLLLGFAPGLVAPLPLAALGHPGCTLYPANPDLALIGLLGPAGSAAPVGIAVPNQPALMAQFFAAQWIAVPPGTLEFSPAAVLQTGR